LGLAETVGRHTIGDAAIQRLKHTGQTRHRVRLATASQNEATSFKLVLYTHTVLGLDFVAPSPHPVDRILLCKERLAILLFIEDVVIEPEHSKRLRKRLTPALRRG
jgi:hypothetical protein